jgi:hypothetical protein
MSRQVRVFVRHHHSPEEDAFTARLVADLEAAGAHVGGDPVGGSWGMFRMTALAHIQQHDTIYHENLQPANMVKYHHLAKSISDAGWGAFLTILTYKAACAGRRIASGQSRLHVTDV